jgi:hypothetical protein
MQWSILRSMSTTDAEFERMMRTAHFLPDTTMLSYAGRQIAVQTGLGDQFRREMREHAAQEVKMPNWLDFNGEFTEDIAPKMSDRVTEALMARVYNPSCPIRIGARVALTGLGLIDASIAGQNGYRPMLIDSKINVFGELAGAGITDYHFISPEVLAKGGVPADVVPEDCTGVVTVIKNLEVRWADTGELKQVPLIQGIVPLAVDELQLHKLA